MKTLNGARRAIGLSGQGLGCSPVVITNTLRQLDRENCSAALPLTVAALKSVLEKKTPVSEKVAVGSLSEINQLRAEVKQRMTMEQSETEAQDEEDPNEMAPGRPS
ncbi:hypothetical protein [Massilia varians]|jgi:hypothetical protein|uniref:hypothetical protein n=1 Tax=Massilia TaxID=149698 RepID=UPI002554B5AD|nr:hypothetical protein [Massilia varians]MDK6076239.1 hypothetical protein [Massilia varians]